jgi:hypothetical protein
MAIPTDMAGLDLVTPGHDEQERLVPVGQTFVGLV